MARGLKKPTDKTARLNPRASSIRGEIEDAIRWSLFIRWQLFLNLFGCGSPG